MKKLLWNRCGRDRKRRGVTLHGPGQIVTYPIIDLIKNNINGPKKYVELIEDIVINSLNMCGYEAKVGEEPGI